MVAASEGKLWRWAKILLPLLCSLAGLFALRHFGHDLVSQHRIREWLAPFGKWAPLAFIAFLAVRPVTLLPGQLFTAVGGLLFGAVAATGYALVGNVFASAVVFVVARRFGGPLMRRAMGGKYQALQRTARHHDFKYSVICCINPLIPTDVAQAAAAASGGRFWPVALGTAVGSLPGTYLTAAFGSAVGQGRTVMPLLMIAGLILSVVLGAFLGRRVKQDLDRGIAEDAAGLTPSHA